MNQEDRYQELAEKIKEDRYQFTRAKFLEKGARMNQEDRYQVRIDITIQQRDQYQGQLRVEETFNVSATDFIELAGILGKFHELAEKIKKESE
jgi:hypothetical protein